MKERRFYSLRMRAAEGGAHEDGGKHISGGEKLARFEDLQENALYLMQKAFTHARGTPDFFQLKVEAISEPIQFIPPLQPKWHDVKTVSKGRQLAKHFLSQCGIGDSVIEQSFVELEQNYHVRGAIVIDVHTGRRIDDRENRGIRVTRFDWDPNSYKKWLKEESTKDNARMKEAIALATKVCSHEATVAELCWSDDPDYTTGYVASPNFGYQRISPLKELGDEQGGRIIFVDLKEDLESYLSFLEKTPVLIGWEEKEWI
ncbi:6-carboxyhexanoate--CoA ligase [Bacillus alveayuensis]|uniref:6-carboxyhexanoate--CoA ligase n=1 Tax=Aeribacillus alveayuensis TaxID=279215 RepID=UPI0005D0ED05|nr:6-carboxyhexanoate--CoA ligase [Bacillus alveayuensis]